MTHRDLAHYNKAYFDKWYRHPRFRVKTALDMERQTRFVIAAAEYMIDRPVRSVLDVGCGEGNWRAVIKRIRPAAHYYGVDASDYVVRRFGKRRNIRYGTFSTLGNVGLPKRFDLVLCMGVLNYVLREELRVGLRHIAKLANGLVYLEIFTRADDATGDFEKEYARWPAWYRREIGAAGFVPLGMHCYMPKRIAWRAAALERASR